MCPGLEGSYVSFQHTHADRYRVQGQRPHLRRSFTSSTTVASRPCLLGGMLRVTVASNLLRSHAGSRYDRYLRHGRSVRIGRASS